MYNYFFTDIGKNAITAAAASGIRSPIKPRDGNKTPQPGDKTLGVSTPLQVLAGRTLLRHCIALDFN